MTQIASFAGYRPKDSSVLATTYNDCCLISHPKRGLVRDAEWEEFNAYLSKQFQKGIGSFVVYSAGVSLSGSQRALSVQILEAVKGEVRIAVLSNCQAVRYAAAALAWVSGRSNMSVFPPEALSEAFKFAGVPEEETRVATYLLQYMIAAQGVGERPSWAIGDDAVAQLESTATS